MFHPPHFPKVCGTRPASEGDKISGSLPHHLSLHELLHAKKHHSSVELSSPPAYKMTVEGSLTMTDVCLVGFAKLK